MCPECYSSGMQKKTTSNMWKPKITFSTRDLTSIIYIYWETITSNNGQTTDTTKFLYWHRQFRIRRRNTFQRVYVTTSSHSKLKALYGRMRLTWGEVRFLKNNPHPINLISPKRLHFCIVVLNFKKAISMKLTGQILSLPFLL